MGVVERREREREEIRQKILDAARQLFERDGYDKVTMRAVADAIEYSPTTIYNHFEDKEDLVRSLCEADFSRLLGRLGQGPLPPDPVERIRQMGGAYARFGLENPNHYRFMFMTPVTFKAGCEHQPSHSAEQAFLLLHSATAEAVASGRFRKLDVDAAAQVLWSSLHGAVALLVTFEPDQFPHAPAVPDLVEHVIEAGIRGLLAPPE